MSEMVYRNTRSWSAANGDTLFGGFARVLVHNVSSVPYHDVRRARSNAATQFTPAGHRYEREHAEHTPQAKTSTDRKASAWTTQRIAELPRTSGKLTRVGDALLTRTLTARITGKVRTEHVVPCICECGATLTPQVQTWMSTSRPQSCRQCSYTHKRKHMAFNNKGYERARSFAQKEKAA